MIAYDSCIPVITAWCVISSQMLNGPSDVDGKIKYFPAQTLKAYREMNVNIHYFLTAALDE
jgi:hypothetical protein